MDKAHKGILRFVRSSSCMLAPAASYIARDNLPEI